MISIIIPFYNTGESCAQLVKQLLNDKQRDIEIICVDDNSTDDSLKIVNAVCKKDKRARTVHQEKNQGSAAARNRGLEEATGDYIVFLDSDDDVAELFLTKMIEGITTDNSVLAVCGIRQNYLHTGKVVDKFTTPASEQNNNETWEEYILRLMIEDAHLYSCVNKIYKRKYITAGKVHFDTKLDFAEDTKFVLDYFQVRVQHLLLKLNLNNIENYEDIVNWADSRSEKTQKCLKKLHLRFKISHALAVARSKKSFRKKCHYENPFILICAKVIVALRG